LLHAPVRQAPGRHAPVEQLPPGQVPAKAVVLVKRRAKSKPVRADFGWIVIESPPYSRERFRSDLLNLAIAMTYAVCHGGVTGRIPDRIAHR
jgi:hypothetical protein